VSIEDLQYKDLQWTLVEAREQQLCKSRKRTSHPNQMFEKKFRIPPFWSPISFPFLICFEWSKNLWGAPIETLQNLFDSKSNETIFKDFKLQITNGFNTPIIKHWSSIFQDPSFPHLLLFLGDLHNYECIKWRFTIPLGTSKETLKKAF